MTEPINIVEALAAADPVRYASWFDALNGPGFQCQLCWACVAECGPEWDPDDMRVEQHAPTCPWRQAKEFLCLGQEAGKPAERG